MFFKRKKKPMIFRVFGLSLETIGRLPNEFERLWHHCLAFVALSMGVAIATRMLEGGTPAEVAAASGLTPVMLVDLLLVGLFQLLAWEAIFKAERFSILEGLRRLTGVFVTAVALVALPSFLFVLVTLLAFAIAIPLGLAPLLVALAPEHVTSEAELTAFVFFVVILACMPAFVIGTYFAVRLSPLLVDATALARIRELEWRGAMRLTRGSGMMAMVALFTTLSFGILFVSALKPLSASVYYTDFLAALMKVVLVVVPGVLLKTYVARLRAAADMKGTDR